MAVSSLWLQKKRPALGQHVLVAPSQAGAACECVCTRVCVYFGTSHVPQAPEHILLWGSSNSIVSWCNNTQFWKSFNDSHQRITRQCFPEGDTAQPWGLEVLIEMESSAHLVTLSQEFPFPLQAQNPRTGVLELISSQPAMAGTPSPVPGSPRLHPAWSGTPPGMQELLLWGEITNNELHFRWGLSALL